MNETYEDVKFERFTDLSAAFERIKAAAPKRVFVESTRLSNIAEFPGRSKAGSSAFTKTGITT